MKVCWRAQVMQKRLPNSKTHYKINKSKSMITYLQNIKYMKRLLSLCLILFLASCGPKEAENTMEAKIAKLADLKRTSFIE